MGAFNALMDNGQVSGRVGLIMSIILLIGGIVSIAARNAGKAGNIAIIILFGIGAVLGYVFAGGLALLYVWATWFLLCALLAVISLIKVCKKTE